MAWQLIYTSAPRLLEAGRSGFGTVARHRAIHPLLVTAIERDSQFDRAAGGIILAHRILTAGGSRFHVLTCIRDAGADYTGRTNHIAHHLVIEPREIAALGSAAPTPADVLAQMAWLPAWHDAPRWLDGTEEIALSRFHRQPARGSAWQAVTGEARCAGLLQPGREACLLLPPGGDALALFAESLGRAPAQAWQATFTTGLQSGDEQADFRWLAIPADSPLSANAGSGRTVLDLTAPDTLPVPPAPSFEMPGTAPASRPPGEASLPVSAPASASAKIGNLFDEKLAVATRPRRERGSRIAMWIGLAAVIVALAGGASFFMMRESGAVKEQRQRIRDTFRSVFGDETGMELAGMMPAEKLAAATALATAAEDTAAALKAGKIPPLLPQAEDAIRQFRATGTELPVPAPVQELISLHKDFHGHQQELWKIEQSGVEAAQLDALHALRDRIEDSNSKLLPRIAPHLRKDTLEAAEKLWEARLIAAIEMPPGKREPEWFRKHFDTLPQSSKNADGGRKAEELIWDWEKVIAAHGNTEKMDALLKERRHLWPAWLVTLANEGKPQRKQAGATDEKKKQEPDSSKEKKLSEEKKRFEGDLMIVLNPEKPEGWTVFAVELQKSGAEPWLKTSDSEGPGRPLKPAGDGFSFNVNDPKKGFVWDKKNFSAGPGAPNPPYELRLQKGGKSLLTAWVTVTDNAAPLRVGEKGSLQREDDHLRITSSEARDLCEKARTLGMVMLELPSSCSPQIPPEKHRIPVETSGSASLEGIVTALNNRIKTETKNHESQQAIADGKPSQRLVAALEPINKVIEQENKERREAAENEAKRKKQPAGKVSEIPLLTHPIKPEDFGRHLQSYVSSSKYNEYLEMFNVGTSLLKLKANEPLAGIIPDAVKAVDKAIGLWEFRMGEGKNSTEKESLKSIRDQKIARLNELRELLVALQNQAELSKTASAKAVESQKIIAALKGHPLHTKDVLPAGEYFLLIQPSGNGPWLTLVLFKIP